MSNRLRLLSVKNAEPLSGLSQLVQRGNELTAEVLAHLAELEERRLHLQLGFPSLFAYCVEALGLSEGSAGRRVAAARVCRRFPGAFELVARGDLHLSARRGLAPHLNPGNATELFTACCRKTRRQVDELLAARFPKPDVREQIRRLPVRGREAAASPQIPGRAGIREEAVAKASVAGEEYQTCLPDAAKVGELGGSGMAGASTVDGPRPPAPAPAPAPASTPRPPCRREIEPLSADRFGVHFTADTELCELLERARALAIHRLPTNDLSSLMRVVLASFVKHEDARRFAVGRKPRRAKADATRTAATPPPATPPPATPPGGATLAITSVISKTAPVGSLPNEVARGAARFAKRSKRSRHIPAAVRRAVYLREQGQCSFVSEDGRRCEARAQLELDHVEPWAKLGDAGVDNIRLRCRAHNQLHARECFGARHIEVKIAARRSSSPPERWEVTSGTAHPQTASLKALRSLRARGLAFPVARAR